MRWVMALVVLWVGSAPASAEWSFRTEDNAFQKPQNLVVADDGGDHAIAFRCSAKGDLVMFLLIGERSSRYRGPVPVQMLVVVDDGPKSTLPANIHVDPNLKFYRVETVAAEVESIVKLAARSKRRIAVAVEYESAIRFQKSFSIAGSGRALDKLITACNL